MVAALSFSLLAAPFAQAAEQKSISLAGLNDCNWMVTYRGRTYDLAPLTREALSRPMESDVRYAIQRVPEADAHLRTMSRHLKDARAHTILASLFVSGLVLSRVLQSGEKNVERKREQNLVSAAAGTFFVAAAAFSWKSTRDAKIELVNAVDAFNRESPHKIEPAPAGAQESTPLGVLP